jgi:hypothetical protein
MGSGDNFSKITIAIQGIFFQITFRNSMGAGTFSDLPDLFFSMAPYPPLYIPEKFLLVLKYFRYNRHDFLGIKQRFYEIEIGI